MPEKFSYDIQKSLERDEPVEVDGIVLYPIGMCAWDEVQFCREAIEYMQQTLPVRYVCMPLLQAFFELDQDAIREGLEPIGLFPKALQMLCLALGVPVTQSGNFTSRVKILADPRDNTRFGGVRISISSEEVVDITAKEFNKLRPIIAAQNGLEIPDESENQELADEREYQEGKNAPKLVYNQRNMLTALAIVEKRNESDYYDWTIKRFLTHKECADRILNYFLCGVSEAMGGKYKHGNPFPNWMFAREKEEHILETVNADVSAETESKDISPQDN